MVTAKVTTTNSKRLNTEQSHDPRIFSGLVMKFLIRKKRGRRRFYDGMVSKSWVKQSSQLSKMQLLRKIRLG